MNKLENEASALSAEESEPWVHDDLPALKQPMLAFPEVVQNAEPLTRDRLAEVHSLFEPAMNLLESQGRKTALQWRARVRSLADPAGVI